MNSMALLDSYEIVSTFFEEEGKPSVFPENYARCSQKKLIGFISCNLWKPLKKASNKWLFIDYPVSDYLTDDYKKRKPPYHRQL